MFGLLSIMWLFRPFYHTYIIIVKYKYNMYTYLFQYFDKVF